MDIKFIGSGVSAKAMLYYITDYITKSQLKTHITYAVLELSVKKLGESDPNEDEVTVRAKKLLQRCTYSMLSHQELSGQQVSSYLMDFEDHFKSNEFQGLYWTSFESYVNTQNPSPECMPVKGSVPIIIDRLNIEEPADVVQQADILSDPPSSYPIDVDGVLPRTEIWETDNSEDSNFESESESESDFDGDNEQNVDDNAVQIKDSEDVLGDEEIIVKVNQSGQLVQQGSHVSDYVLRGLALKHLSLWEYTARVKKEYVINLYKHTKVNACEDSDDAVEDEEDMNLPVKSVMEGDWTSADAILDDRHHK